MKLRKRLAALLATSIVFTSVPVIAQSNLPVENSINAVQRANASDAKYTAIFDDMSDGNFGTVGSEYTSIRDNISTITLDINLQSESDFHQ